MKADLYMDSMWYVYNLFLQITVTPFCDKIQLQNLDCDCL